MGEPTLKINLLGTFRLELKGQEVPLNAWKSKKAMLLCKYLACRRGKKVQRAILADLLWPEATAENLEHNLHTVVYMLRRTLEPELKRFQPSKFISHCNGLYWFRADAPCVIDTEEFERLIQLGNDLITVNPQQALKCYLKALELYKDDFLLDELYADWAVEYRVHYRECFLATSLQASQLLAKYKQDYVGAVRLCRQALQKEPCREDLHEAIISYWIEAKRYDQAVAQYKQCEELLNKEYGLEPSKEVQALLTQIPSVTEKTQTSNVSAEADRGAFICDATLFTLIHQLERRRQSRNEAPLLILTVSTPEFGQIHESILLAMIAGALRRGDVVAKTGEAEFQVLLVDVEPAALPIIERRINRALKTIGSMPAKFSHIVEFFPLNSQNILKTKPLIANSIWEYLEFAC